MNNTKYVIQVNGQNISPTFDTITLAESYLNNMVPTQQAVAEIKTVNGDGKEILFG